MSTTRVMLSLASLLAVVGCNSGVETRGARQPELYDPAAPPPREEDLHETVVRLPSGEERRVLYQLFGDVAVTEGDIVLWRSEPNAKPPVAPPPQSAGRAADSGAFWFECGVAYTIDPGLENRQRVTDAMTHWTVVTRSRCVFMERLPSVDRDFITFRTGTGCSSNVGRQGGQQFIDLAPGCDTGAVIHEIGHALGLWHEQSRSDRDRNVTIRWENIEPGMEYNFRTYGEQGSDGRDMGPYDYGSIMHYGAYAFSRNGQPTIVTPHGEAIGQRTGLSSGDVNGVNTMYPCRGGSLCPPDYCGSAYDWCSHSWVDCGACPPDPGPYCIPSGGGCSEFYGDPCCSGVCSVGTCF